MAIKITINTENAAFVDSYGSDSHGSETASILRQLADDLDGLPAIFPRPVYDSNGNRVGAVEIGANA